MRLTVAFDAGFALDQIRVQIAPSGQERLVPDPPRKLSSGTRLVLLVPDDWAGITLSLNVRGLSADRQVASGQVSATPRRAEVVDVAVTLSASCSCILGETRCEKGQFRVCHADVPGCANFSAPQPCPSDKPVCSGDVCTDKCSNQCSSGQRRCRDSGYQVCGYSEAGCLDWNSVITCGSGEVCRASDGVCLGGSVDRGMLLDGPRRDARNLVDARPMPPNLPVTPGVFCPTGACGPNLVCVTGVCLRTCVQPDANCNDKAAACGADEACAAVTSTISACYPKQSKIGESCDATGCAGGSVCIQINTGPYLCRGLCKYGCPPSQGCAPSDALGCQVCIP